MNRILKKAISFFSAVAISVSTLAAGAVTASAQSIKIKQTVANKYEHVIAMSESALFIAEDNSMVMFNNKGKKVAIKNTVSIDKIYTIGTMFEPYVMNSGYDRGGFGNIVLFQKGKKFKALLQDGSFLADGKLFDSVKPANGNIHAVSGSYHYLYTTDNKLLSKVKTDKEIELKGYDERTKTTIALHTENSDDGFVYSAVYTYYLIRKGKIFKTITDCTWESHGVFTDNGKTYLSVHTKNDEDIVYTMSGKKTTKVTYKYPSRDTQEVACALTLEDDSENNKLLLKNAKTGKTVKSYSYSNWRYRWFNEIHTLQNGKSFFISCSADGTKYGCITF